MKLKCISVIMVFVSVSTYPMPESSNVPFEVDDIIKCIKTFNPITRTYHLNLLVQDPVNIHNKKLYSFTQKDSSLFRLAGTGEVNPSDARKILRKCAALKEMKEIENEYWYGKALRDLAKAKGKKIIEE